jgi:hypothetical protein
MVVDDRTPAFIWATCEALAVIREGVKNRSGGPRLPVVMATYIALLEIANERHLRPDIGFDSKDPLAATNARVAALAGVGQRSVPSAVRVLEGLGLVEVEYRREGEVRNAPNKYSIKEPAPPDVRRASQPARPANRDVRRASQPANRDVRRASVSKKEHPRRRGTGSNSGTASGEIGDIDRLVEKGFLSNGNDGDFEPDDLASLLAGGDEP